MALSDDQRALLRLLAQREQGYDDIAALKGMSVDDVRTEVRAALAAMDAPPPEPPPPPPPPGPAPSAPEPTPAPVAPSAQPKATPKAPRPQRAAVPAERRRIVLVAGGALALVAIVLGAVAIFSGGSDSGSSSASTGAPATEVASSGGEGSVTQAVLESADGSEASGRAIFGRVGKKEVVLQVTAESLEPTEEGESYTVWLYRSPKLSLRVGSVPVGETGKLGARFAIPAELLAYVASGAFNQIYVSRTSNAAYQQEVARAKQEKSLPRYTGETVLNGEITGPVAKAGQEEGG